MRIVLFVALIVACLNVNSVIAQQKASDVPMTLEEGLSRLEKVLNRYTDQDNRQWQFVIDDEVRMTPESGKSILIVRKGNETYGSPVRSGDLIEFDNTLSTQRTIFDLGKDGDRKLSRELQNHATTRFSLRRNHSGDWFYDAVFLSHSNPEYRNRPIESGRVKWEADSVELIGFGTDNFFRQGGVLAPGAFLIKRKLSRQVEHLIEEVKSQSYELTKSPDGDDLPFPDFTKPFGDLFVRDKKSEPLKDK